MSENTLPVPVDDVARRAMSITDQSRAHLVFDEDTYKKALILYDAIRNLEDEVDRVFDPIIKRAHEAHKEALAQKKAQRKPLEEAEAEINLKAREWRRRQDEARLKAEAEAMAAARREAEEQRLREAAELEAQGRQDEASMILDMPVIAIAPAVSPAIPCVPKVDGVSARKVWKFRIVNEAMIPRQYLSPDPVKIGAVVRACKGTTSIPGVEVYCEDTLTRRS